MSRSLLSNEKRCFFCNAPDNLDRHHIFFGTANRKLSEEDGCWVWLCVYHHTLSDMSVHHNRNLDLILKGACQGEWEKQYGGREAFIKRYGKSWIMEDKDEVQS